MRLTRRLSPAAAEPGERRRPEAEPPAGRPVLSLPIACLLAALCGYVSLSQEILWTHALSFTFGNRPQTFGLVLGFILLGVAFGSLAIARLTSRRGALGQALLPLLFVAAAAIGTFALPLLGAARSISGGLGTALSHVLAFGMMAALALAACSVLPLLCHLGIQGRRRAGSALSLIYFANVAGSALGPLLTTFVLMNRFDLGELTGLLTGLSLAGAAISLAPRGLPPRRKAVLAGAGAAVLIGVLAAHGGLYGDLLDRLQFQSDFASKSRRYAYIRQSRSGIVGLSNDAVPQVFGDGSYDGMLNVDPVTDQNFISRCYMMAALHRRPARVLEIGMSAATWTRVIAGHPLVEHMDVIEINPAYLDLIRSVPGRHASILSDPKVHIHIDDARRWLRSHGDARYDVIVVNTIQNQRSYATNLLSEEFMGLVKAHLSKGGVYFFNTTKSEDAYRTAASVFRHMARYLSMAAASDAPFDMTPTERLAALQSMTLDGARPLGDGRPETSRRAAELAMAPLSDIAPALRRRADLWVITDDNMATEFRRGFRPPLPRLSLHSLLSKLAQL